MRQPKLTTKLAFAVVLVRPMTAAWAAQSASCAAMTRLQAP